MGDEAQVFRYRGASLLIHLAISLSLLTVAALLLANHMQPWLLALASFLAGVAVVDGALKQFLLAGRGFIRLDDLGITLRDHHGKATFIPCGRS